MGIRFRKSVKILPGVRINIGKNGITSATIGPRGASININRKRANLNTSLPGTGLSSSQRLADFQQNPANRQPVESQPNEYKLLKLLFKFILFIVFAPMIFEAILFVYHKIF